MKFMHMYRQNVYLRNCLSYAENLLYLLLNSCSIYINTKCSSGQTDTFRKAATDTAREL